VALRGALEGVDQHPQRGVEAEHRVLALVVRVAEEAITRALIAELFVRLGAVRENHVVNALEGVARDARLGADDVQILLERTFPVLAAELFEVLSLGQERNDLASMIHGSSSTMDQAPRRPIARGCP